MLPSGVVTVITAVPKAFAVTLPFSSTVATSVLLDVHVNSASAGMVVAFKAAVSPIPNFNAELSNAIEPSITITSQAAVIPCKVLTVIVALPASLAVKTPFSTVTTFSSEEVQINVLSAGFTVAFNVSVPFDTIVTAELSKVNFTWLFAVYTELVSTVSPFTRTSAEIAGTVTCPSVTVPSTSVPASLSLIQICHVPSLTPISPSAAFLPYKENVFASLVELNMITIPSDTSSLILSVVMSKSTIFSSTHTSLT